METCPVCEREDCRPHSHTGPLQRCLGGKGLDQKGPVRPIPGRRKKRSKKGPVEDRMVRGPREDRC